MSAVETQDERKTRAALRVLDTLDRLDARMDAHYSGERSHHRRNFRAQVSVFVPEPGAPLAVPTDEPTFRAWGRSLSESGMSLLHTEAIEVDSVLVGFDLPNGERTWCESEIVRRRTFGNEGFHEFGLVFRGRA